MRLNLGAGGVRLDGWTSADLHSGDVRHDLAETPWPFDDGAASALLASHVLEHFDKAGGRAFLRECRRVLAPGGLLAIAVPDLDRFITARLTGKWDLLGGYRWTDLNDLCGGGASEPNPAQRHRYAYTWEALAWALTEEGFTPRRVTFDTSAAGAVHTAAYRAISLYVDAIRT